PHPLQSFRMGDPATERHGALNVKALGKLFESAAFLTITDDAEPGSSRLQQWCGGTQGDVTGLVRHETTDIYQLERTLTPQPDASVQMIATDSILGDEEHFVAICLELAEGVRRPCNDRGRIAVRRARERQKAVGVPEAGNPFPLPRGLAEAR